MLHFAFSIIGFFIGVLISHYTSFLINKCEDKQKDVIFKLLSMRTFIICVIDSVLWLTLYILLGMSVISILYMMASSILLALSVVDFAAYEIPPQFNVALAVIGVVVLAMDYTHWYEYVIGAFTVSGIFYLMALATKGRGMGGGDIKLMAAAGLILGWKKILFSMVFGAILGVLIHSIAMAMLKKKSMLAFGPYLSMGIYIMMILGGPILSWYIANFLTF